VCGYRWCRYITEAVETNNALNPQGPEVITSGVTRSSSSLSTKLKKISADHVDSDHPLDVTLEYVITYCI